jgi:SAM-dependent methyltransferase
MNGWEDSTEAWIADLGESGDTGRRYILDRAMRERLSGRGFATLLDVGCGEGRLCRMAQAWGMKTTGLDPTRGLLNRARELDPAGHYVEASAEHMPFEAAGFDAVVSCMSLIDIPDYRAAIAEMARVLKPGGTLLVANLTPMQTAGEEPRWHKDLLGNKRFYALDHYMTERSSWEEWRGIRVQNWHRPLSAYMQAFLHQGLLLTHFDEPLPDGGDPAWIEDYKRMPWFLVMEWRKPSGSSGGSG